MKKLLLILLVPIFGLAQVPDPIANTYVNDLAGMLNAGQIQVLNDSILAIEKKSSVQIAVVLLDKLPENMSIEDFSLQVGRKWHVGNAANGLVYVVALAERKQRLEVARALESKITDIDALQLTDQLKPYFREKDYFTGLKVLLDGISKKLDPVLQEQLALAKAEADKKANEQTEAILYIVLPIVVIGGGIFFFIWWTWRERRKLKMEQEETVAREMAYRLRDQAEQQPDYQHMMAQLNRGHTRRDFITPPSPDRLQRNTTPDIYIAPVYSDQSPSSSSSGSDSSSSSDSGSSSSYGDWGGGSSDNSASSSSGFDGGGASNDF